MASRPSNAIRRPPPAFLSFSRPGQALAWLRFSNDKIGYDTIGDERIFQKIPRSTVVKHELIFFFFFVSNATRSILRIRDDPLLPSWKNFFRSERIRLCVTINFRWWKNERFPSKQRYYFSISARSLAARKIDERSSRLLDGRKSEGMTTARMRRRRERRKRKARGKKEGGRKRKHRAFLTSVLGGARNAILMKNAESTRIPAHSY